MNPSVGVGPLASASLILSVTFAMSVGGVHAQTFDRGFAPPLLWERFTDYTFSRGPFRGVADGRGGVLLVGNAGADVVAGQWLGEPIRLREADGTINPEFRSALGAGVGIAVAVQPDGKVLVQSYASRAYVVLRLLASGGLDPSFTPIGFSQSLRHLAVLPSGQILASVQGSHHRNPSPQAIQVPSWTVFRLQANGGIDASFRVPEFEGAFSLAPPATDAKGRIYIGGMFTSCNGVGRTKLVRLLPNGEVDESFAASLSVPGGLGGRVRDVVLQSDGRVVVTGGLLIPAGAPSRDQIVAIRFDADGQFDESFTRYKVSDLGSAGYPSAVVLQPDDKFVTVSSGLRRFNRDGTRDLEFASPDFPVWVYELTLLSDGRLLVSGANSSEGVAVYTTNGTPDLTFKPGGFGHTPWFQPSYAFLEAGPIAVCGKFNRVGLDPQLGLAILDSVTGAATRPQPDLARFTPDDAIMDFSMDWPTKVVPGPTNTCWFVAGIMDTNQEPHLYFGRMLATGTFDPAVPVQKISRDSGFSIGSDLVPLPDGRLFTVSSPSIYLQPNPLQRLLPNGTVDPSFAGLDASLLNQLVCVRYAPDHSIERVDLGDIRVLGHYKPDQLLLAANTCDGDSWLVRVDYDGRLDDAFAAPVVTGLKSYLYGYEVYNPLTGWEDTSEGVFAFADEVFRQAAELPDGKVFIAGTFVELAGAPVAHLARLNRDGSLDRTHAGLRLEYSQSQFVEPEIESIQVDAHGRTYVAGAFDRINLHPAPGLARLLPDGTVDQTFQSPLDVSRFPATSVELKLVGEFLYVLGPCSDGQDRRMAWRMRVDERPSLSWSWRPRNPLELLVPTNPRGATVLQASDSLLDWVDLFTNQMAAPAVVFTDPDAPVKTNRYYRLKQ